MLDANVKPLAEEARGIINSLLDEIAVDQKTRDLESTVTISGNPEPYFPLPYKNQACIVAIQSVFGIIANRISELRFGKAQSLTVNTDHASAFFCGAFLSSLDGHGITSEEYGSNVPEVNEDPNPNMLKTYTTTIFKCKDGRYFYLHGSFMSRDTLKLLGIDPEQPADDMAQARQIIQKTVDNFTAQELLQKVVEAGFCGDICYKPEEYDETEQGKIMNKKPILEIHSIGPDIPPTPFTKNPSSGKILDGVKIVELTRVVAGAVIGRCLAELGATIVRVISPDLPDFRLLQPDFNLGKRPTHINLKTAVGRTQLEYLLQDADVFIQSYRPGHLESLGYGPKFLSDIAAKRGKGIVILNESCYGDEGPWAFRPGYQQIADAITGVSWQGGIVCGKNSPITPHYPISDYGTGVIGAIAVLHGLLKRAELGGSWNGYTSLTQFNLFLRRQGQYPHEMVRKLYEQGPPLDYDWSFADLLIGVTEHFQKTRPAFFSKANFDLIPETPFGKNFVHIAPVCRWSDHPTRFNSTAPWGYYRPGWDEEDADKLEKLIADQNKPKM